MTKHPAARRVHREAADEDVFVSGVLEGGVWAKHHGRALLIGSIAIVVALVLFFYVRHFNAQAEAKAATDLTAVRQTMMEGNRELAMRDLSSFVKKYGKTPSADEARLLLAQVYLEAGQATSAITTIKPIAGDPSKSNGASAAMILAAAYELNKQTDLAEQTYLKVADKARFGFEKREALERAAILRLNKGNTAGAAQLYEQAMNTLPETEVDQRNAYQMRIAEVRASGARTGG